MPQPERFTVRGFKSVRALEDFELRPLNVLIGANGAGKSNFMCLFRMMSELIEGRLQLFVREQDGPSALLFGGSKRTAQLDVEFRFANGTYAFSLRPVAAQLAFSREEIRVQGTAGEDRSFGSGHAEARITSDADSIFASYVRPAMSAWRVHHFNDTSATALIRQPQPVRDDKLLKPDGSNLAPFLRHLRERHTKHFERIVETLRQVAPFFGDFVYRQDPPEHIELEWYEASDPRTVRGPRQLSDGTLRFICLATVLQQPVGLQPETILIDEPELGLHPYAISVLASLLRQVSDTQQLIVSTQSVDLVNELEPQDIIVAGRHDGASSFERLDTDRLAQWLQDYSLGELWKMNVLGGRPAR
jgi:predicted ATPase